MSFLKNFFVEEEGQDMVEYGLVIALVVVGGITAYGLLSTQINLAIGAGTSAIAKAL